jgi:hypothetical protein
MAQPARTSIVNEPLLAERLGQVAAALPDAGDLLDAFAVFVRTAEDDELVRINPIRFAQRYELPEAAVVEFFLNGRKRGLLTMEWQ